MPVNSNPEGINYPIPGNDDARRSIDLYCSLMKETIMDAKNNIKGKEEDVKIEEKMKENIQTDNIKKNHQKKLN